MDDQHSKPSLPVPVTNTKQQAWFTNERLNLLLALCAIVISAASFYATYLQASAAERQVKAATWPWLEVISGNFNVQEKVAEITLEITNSGSGPAIIKYVQYFHNDQSYVDIYSLIKDCCFDVYAYEKQLLELQEKSPKINFFEQFGWLFTSESQNRLLAAGTSISLLNFKRTSFNDTQWQTVDKQRFKISTSICYCSLLEQCYISDGRGTVSEVEHCALND